MANPLAHRPTLFDVFKARCSNTDLGPTSLNWFEELTSEAPRCDSKSTAELDSFKTPNCKMPAYSQLASTPIIFKPNSQSPLFTPPTKKQGRCRSLAEKDNVFIEECPNSLCSVEMKPDLSNEVFSPPLNNTLNESPAAIREMFRTPRRLLKCAYLTPQQHKRNEICGSLFCTPKLLRGQASKCISESLGAEVDPEMSWSSSLATPPTLSSTVIIAKGNDQLSGSKPLDDSTDIIVHRLLTKHEGKGEMPTLTQSVNQAVAFECDAKHDDTAQNMDESSEGVEGCEEKLVLKNPAWKQTVPDALEDGEVRQAVENVLDGMGDVLSVFFTSRKPVGLRKVKTINRARKKQIECSELDESQKARFSGHINKDICLTSLETHFESSSYNLSVKNMSTIRMHLETVPEDPTQENVPSSLTSQWSHLNLSGLNVTQLENMTSYVPCSSFNVFSMNCLEEGIVGEANTCSNKSSLEVPNEAFCLPQEKRELNFNASQNGKKDTADFELQTHLPVFKESIQETSLSNDLYLVPQSPTFSKPNTLTNISNVKSGESYCFSLQNQSLGNVGYASGSNFHGNLTDDCTTIGPNQFDYHSRLPCKDGKNYLNGPKPTELEVKGKAILSRLKKQPKKFIYSINDVSIERGPKNNTHLKSESALSIGSPTLLNSCLPKKDDEGTVCLRPNILSEKETSYKNGTEKNKMNDELQKTNDWNNEMKNDVIANIEATLQDTALLKGTEISSSDHNQCLETTIRNVSSIKRKVLAAATLLKAKRFKIESTKTERSVQLPDNSCILSSGSNDTGNDDFRIYSLRDRCVNVEESHDASGVSRFLETKCVSQTWLGDEIGDLNSSNQENPSYVSKQEVLPSVTNNEVFNLSLPKQGPQKENHPECIRTADKVSHLVPFHTAGKTNVAVSSAFIKKENTIFDQIESTCLNQLICIKSRLEKCGLTVEQRQTLCGVIPNDVPTNLSTITSHVADSQSNCYAIKSQLPSTCMASEAFGRSTVCLISQPDLKTSEPEGTTSDTFPDSFVSTFKGYFGGFKTASDKPIQITENSVKKGRMLFKEIEEHFIADEKGNNILDSFQQTVYNKKSLHCNEDFKPIFSNLTHNFKNNVKTETEQIRETENYCCTEIQAEPVDCLEDIHFFAESKMLSLPPEGCKPSSNQQNYISENAVKGKILCKEIEKGIVTRKINENYDTKMNVSTLAFRGDTNIKKKLHQGESDKCCNARSSDRYEDLIRESQMLPESSKSILNYPFEGFRTSSNKHINSSENIRKGRMLFQEIGENFLTGINLNADIRHNFPLQSLFNKLPSSIPVTTPWSTFNIHMFEKGKVQFKENQRLFPQSENGLVDSQIHSEPLHVSENTKKVNMWIKGEEEQYCNGNMDRTDCTKSSSNLASGSSNAESNLQVDLSDKLFNKEIILVNQMEIQCTAENPNSKFLIKDSTLLPVSNAFSGFRTASNKPISVSEKQIENSKGIFKELEDDFLKGLCQKEMENILIHSVQNMLTPSPLIEQKLSTPIVSCSFETPVPTFPILINTENTCDTKIILQDLPTKQISDRSQSLTDSQKAEITELSNMLEANYSQFEFTQFRKMNSAITNDSNTSFGNACTDETAQMNNSDVWKDVDFNDSFDKVVSVSQPLEVPDLKNNVATSCEFNDQIAHLENEKCKYEPVDHARGNGEHASCLVPLHTSSKSFLFNCEGFRFASGKKIDIDQDVMVSAGKIFSAVLDSNEQMDFDEKDFKKHPCSSNGKSPACMEADTHFVTTSSKTNFDNSIMLKETPPRPRVNNCVTVIKDDQHKLNSIKSDGMNSLDKGDKIWKNESSDKTPNPPEIGVSFNKKHSNCGLHNDFSQSVMRLNKAASVKNAGMFNSCSINNKNVCFASPNNEAKKKINIPGGFQTAGGRNISVSTKSLTKACSLFDEEHTEPVFVGDYLVDSITLEGEKNSTKNTFVHTKPVVKEAEFVDLKNGEISTRPLIHELAHVTENTRGFHTASGKKVTVTDESLAKVKTLFSEKNLLTDLTEKTTKELTKEQTSDLVWGEGKRQGAIPTKNCSVAGFKNTKSIRYPTCLKSAKITEIKNEATIEVLSEMQRSAVSSQDVELSEHTDIGFKGSEMPRTNKPTLSLSTTSVGFCTGKGNAIHFKDSSFLKAKEMFKQNDLHKLAQNDPCNHISSNEKSGDTLVHLPVCMSTDLDTNECSCTAEKNVRVAEVGCCYDTELVYGSNNFYDSNRNPLCVETDEGNTMQQNKTKTIPSDESSAHSQNVCRAFPSFTGNDAASYFPNTSAFTKHDPHSKKNFKEELSFYSAEAMHKPNQLGPITFSTASGKKVGVSDDSLRKAKQIFNEICNSEESPVKSIKIISMMNQVEVSASCPKDAASPTDSTKLSTLLPMEDKSTGSSSGCPFSTARGKPVIIQEKALKHVRMTFADMDNENTVQIYGFQKADDCHHKLSSKKCSALSDTTLERQGFFNTADEKTAQLSGDTLQKGPQLVSDVDSNNVQANHKGTFALQSLYERDTTNHAGEGKLLKTTLNQTSENSTFLRNLVDSKTTFGFNKASGKRVLISERALEKVKYMLKEFDDLGSIDDKSFSERENPCPTKKMCISSLSQTGGESVEKTGLSSQDRNAQVEKSVQALDKSVHCSKMSEESLLIETKVKATLQPNVSTDNSSSFFDEHEWQICSSVKPTAAITTEIEKNPIGFLAVTRVKAAVENAKVLMEDDDLTEGRVQDEKKLHPSKKGHYLKNGKRLRSKEVTSLGEPPMKRQLLPEFDRIMEKKQTSLKALKSTPDDGSKDRRKFLYNVPLKPVTCSPPSGMKGRNESRIPRFTAPDKDLEGFNGRTTIFQNKLRNHSAADPSLPMTPCGKTLATESEKLKNVHVPCKSVKTFVPPCTTKARTPGESGNAATFDTFKDDTRIEHDQMEEPNARRVESNVPVTESGTAQYSTLLGDGEHNNQGLREMIENLHCARDMQMMRIRKKQRQLIRPQPGSLYMTKTSTQDRIPFKTAVEGKCLFAYSYEQLHVFGVLKHSIMVNSENAELFQFDCLDHFTKDDLHAGQGIQIADGGWLIPSDNHKAGKEELYRALCDTPGVDPKLISGPWAYNHYRWIVWKLAAMEVSFPEKFASSCLTPERVLLQLKYRYDLEVDKSQRSAVKKIMERDDTAAKTLVLCISKIISMGTNMLSPNNSKCSVADGKNSASIIEVTDGWYGIKAILDTPLSALVSRKRILVGSKIIVHGAELIGSEDACTPLEAPESLMLKISANGTRLARWYALLGFHKDPRPFPLLLSSLFSDGGIVGCIDVIIQRTYPLQWMEKMANGMYIFRNERAEEREAEKHAAKQQKNLEALFVKIQAEFEQNEVKAKRQKVKRRTLSRKQVYEMQDGAELYEAIQNESDPGYLESCLSDEQLRALNSHRQILNDKKQAEVQAEFRRAMESDEHGQNACGKRDVTAIWKLRIVDYKNQGQDAAFILNIWRPLSGVRSLLKEGGRYKMFHLSTSHSKSKSDICDVQLTATKKTQYQQLQPSQEILSSIYRPRHAVQFTELLEPSFHTLCSEVDLVGYIVSVSRKSGLPPLVYLSDENYNFIAIKFWTDLGQLGIEDVMTPSTLIACSNIQWRKNSNLSIPTMFAGELSIVSTNPKDRHLREAICKLKSTVQEEA
ncbi:breast cancer type 2 susceptibility protein isoform X2 [Ambystoma mexicanum]|uniref:breast cancer type 2 susceptibility protein isoform X2 n=1 Tax=Ambystoma mexicanum TaxID=8296 RepID=UPI0037E92B67